MKVKRNMNQPLPQSGQLERHAIDRHYSDACDCRTCRRLRRKGRRERWGPLDWRRP